MCAEVAKGNCIHWRNITVSRDFGSTLGVSSGLPENTTAVVNSTDDLIEGMTVQPMPSAADK